MKSLRNITAIASVLALAGTSLASAVAPEKIYITGSTAYRNQAIQAINTLFGGTNTGAGTLGSGITLASAAIPANASFNASYTQGLAAKPTTFTFYGGSIGGTPVTIKASFTGSVGGLIQISASKVQLFLPDSDTGGTTASQASGAAAVPTLNYPDPTVTGNPAESAVPTIAFSDTFQSTTGLVGTVGGTTYANLSTQDTSGIVGANPFDWVVSASGKGVITNITDKIAYALNGSGDLFASAFTGNASNTQPVIATGRDFDSGTRITALADTGILAAKGNTVVQYNPIVPGSLSSTNPYGTPLLSAGVGISELAITAPLTLNGIHTVQGNGGYHNGPDLAIALANTSASVTLDNADSSNVDADGNPEPYQGSTQTLTSPIFVAYLSTGDAGTESNAAQSTPGAILSYNGVTYTAAAMNNGQYSFWGYEHIYNTVPGTDAAATSFVSSLISGVKAATGTPVSALQVARSTDGAPILPKNTPF